MNEAEGAALLGKPRPHVVSIAQTIRLHLGIGGATFPGADELYAAAEKIEAWQQARFAKFPEEWNAQR